MSVRCNNSTFWSSDNGLEETVQIKCKAAEGFLCGTLIKLDSLSYGNNIDDLNVTGCLPKMTSLPTASAAYINKTYLLTAPQTGYKEGGIYKCVSDGEPTPTYSWQLISSADMVEFTAQELLAMW